MSGPSSLETPGGLVSESSPMDPVSTCGAKTRSGVPCKRPPTPGRKRCWYHGGANPGAPAGNLRGLRHGVFSDRLLSEAECEEYERLRAQGLAPHFILARLKEARAWAYLDAMTAHPNARAGFDIVSIEQIDADGNVVSRRRYTDPWALVFMTTRKVLKMVEASVEAELAQQGIVLPQTKKRNRRKLNEWLRGGK